jgi:hypothetical protein
MVSACHGISQKLGYTPLYGEKHAERVLRYYSSEFSQTWYNSFSLYRQSANARIIWYESLQQFSRCLRPFFQGECISFVCIQVRMHRAMLGFVIH